ncbi:DNA-binding response OmpR family regulator [Clostridium acetobutylicum]|uniref:Stage 0 sporulation protein A homolog n=1 Tax=Clostridium acetobutylicum (strain ATCC 824 / DSM 792 / JCM 1419 / IAM 19013 / LMG 5710 / NBRC 13948 / NRRL B-527 / VKM B-1787 / 2291 / W) TaxID=272562 RepID=Q97KQ7_CLOAB|nr:MULTISPECIES: response regulator transcription factor [Clostridium]AAK78836.1 Two-component response regulator [Clostridium acetobutylicum ATCC 824]ADZ19911.1 Two-component response regulator [Clostridium acetobutylicum EA 2018]AEI34311.1 two-component response regulator [Clostridium acetobutylicum DSM 1731]AWV80555.1 DNA-binding response regulator [Clostridium acetobutylicum]MBC2392745.1 response regulator transcription factor [Clostridium acetobutylicum]
MEQNINIIVVEDDNDINNMLKIMLERKGYNVVQAYSGTEALLHVKTQEFQLMLLDLMLPGISGDELLQKVRGISAMPVIVISAKLSKDTKVRMLKIGADDYITKPFDMDDVDARIYSNLRRYIKFGKDESFNSKIVFKDMILDSVAMEVIVNGQRMSLTNREFKILEVLLLNKRKVFSKANLFESVWEDTYMGDDNTLNVHISNLRNKLLKANSKEEYIETVWGMGYRLKI